MKCISGESNPGQLIGSEICYHYTTDADAFAGNRTLMSPLATVYSTTKLRMLKFGQRGIRSPYLTDANGALYQLS